MFSSGELEKAFATALCLIGSGILVVGAILGAGLLALAQWLLLL